MLGTFKYCHAACPIATMLQSSMKTGIQCARIVADSPRMLLKYPLSSSNGISLATITRTKYVYIITPCVQWPLQPVLNCTILDIVRLQPSVDVCIAVMVLRIEHKMRIKL